MYNPNQVKTRLGVIRYSLFVNSFEKSAGKITSHLQKRYKNFWDTTGAPIGCKSRLLFAKIAMDIWCQVSAIRCQVSGEIQPEGTIH